MGITSHKPITVDCDHPVPLKARSAYTLAYCYFNGAVFHTELDSICGQLITHRHWPVSTQQLCDSKGQSGAKSINVRYKAFHCELLCA